MGLISTLLNFVRNTLNGANVSSLTVDIGGGVNHTAEHYADPGDDSYPLLTDYVLVIDTLQSGGKAAIGYVDPINEPKTNEGDKRIYARDPSNGAVICEVWLKNDGSILLENANGSILLNANGVININGVTIDTSGNITANSITAPSAIINGVELANHVHAQPNDGAGDTEANTTGPIGGP